MFALIDHVGHRISHYLNPNQENIVCFYTTFSIVDLVGRGNSHYPMSLGK